MPSHGALAGKEGHTTEQSSWEVISRHSSGSTPLSLVQDAGSTACLVPLWELLQEAFKSPWAHVNGRKLALQEIIPDLLFVDLPRRLLYRSGDDPAPDDPCPSPPHPPLPSQESSGLRITLYYTLDLDEECVRQPAGANKAVSGGVTVRVLPAHETLLLQLCQKRCLARVRADLEALLPLTSPQLVRVLGLHFSPPSLALEAAPHGSLRAMVKQGGLQLTLAQIHCITLQVLTHTSRVSEPRAGCGVTFPSAGRCGEPLLSSISGGSTSIPWTQTVCWFGH